MLYYIYLIKSYIVSILLHNILYVFTEFHKKYHIEEQLIQGGCSFVYKGFRKVDKFPVSIES